VLAEGIRATTKQIARIEPVSLNSLVNHHRNNPGTWPDSNGAATLGSSDARYRASARWAGLAPDSKASRKAAQHPIAPATRPQVV